MKRVTYAFIISVVLSIILSVPSASQYSKEVRKTVDIAIDGRVDIDTYKGSIIIGTWDQPMVEVFAKIVADGRSRDDRDMVEDTEIRIHATSDRVEIVSDYGRRKNHGFSLFGLFGDNGGSLPFVEYVIKLPAAIRLKIKDYKSETKISDMISALRLETYKGSVIVNNHKGPLDLETYKGEAKIDFAKFSDDCSFETYKGRIRIAIPKDEGFKLRADMGRRANFMCDFDMDTRKRSRDDDYIKASINGGGPDLLLNTTKGDIELIDK